ncbi:MAG: MerR family transcriptional regulator [Eubacterium sp.]|nr:MerR family transcriptional regulator [Eubacterium sp.]
MKEKRYSISEASRLLEVENHVLRYWEDELDLKIPRNELGHRFYREEEIQLLYCIKELKNKGFQLKAVKEVLPDLEEKKLIDVHKLLATQVELENMGAQEEEEEKEKKYVERTYTPEEVPHDQREEEPDYDNKNCKVVALRKGEDRKKLQPVQESAEDMPLRKNEAKMMEFESIMGRIIGRALREQAETMGDVMGDRICDKVMREIDEVMVEQEAREEARYKKLDETIRNTQRARQEIAVAKDEGNRKKSRFFKKNKRKI